MGKHAKHARAAGRWRTKRAAEESAGGQVSDERSKTRAEKAVGAGAVRVRALPLRSTVRLRRPVDIWHKPALSAVVALGVPDLVLLGLGRLDLVLYTSAGAMCALYAHGLPYAARARALSWVVLGMVASLAVALTAASLVTSAAVLVVLASLVAAVHKMVCDASRIGPPGNLILTFIAASAFFVPQRPAEVLPHAGLALATGAFAWLVCMAPALVRPRGPERIATARALEAAAGLLRARAEAEADGVPSADGAEPAGVAHARHATAAAVNAAWHTLFLVPVRTSEKAAARAGLERLLVRAESALGGTPPDPAAEGGRLAGWARELRSGRPLPEVTLTAVEAAELAGVAWESGVALEPGMALKAGSGRGVGGSGLRRPAPGRPRGVRAVVGRLRPGSPLLPIGARVALGCVLAGWASMAVGVGHPYWAVVTAASIYQANTTLSWQRAFQRTLGNLLGLALFTVLLPVTHTGHVAMVVMALAFQLGAEAMISRNYWLGSVCVTPMALLLTEFGRPMPAGTLIADRWLDTVVGAAVGLVCCVLVTNRRAADRIELALAGVARAEEAASRLLAADGARRSSETGATVGTITGSDSRSGSEPGSGAGSASSGAGWVSEPGSAWPLPEPAPKPELAGAGSPPAACTPREAGWARDRLAGSLVELREAVEVASGEWWQRALPEERIARAEQQGHRTLAALVRRLSAPALAA